MVTTKTELSPQEQRIAEGWRGGLTSEDARTKRARVHRMLAGFRDKPPEICVGVAQLYTESLKQTESLPLVIRAAKALDNVARHIDVSIGEEELIVGHCGSLKRHAVFYPQHRGLWFEEHMAETLERKVGNFSISEEAGRAIREDILPYWKGKTIHEAYLSLLPEDARRLFYDKDIYTTRGIIDDKGTARAFPQYVPDYDKVLTKGFNGIKTEAEEKLASLSAVDGENSFHKLPFLKAVIIICDAMVAFAGRYAELARSMAKSETNPRRRQELLDIAGTCDRVPGNPARTFREAIQSHWFTRVGLTFEADTSALGSGRMDQLLYPYYVNDIKQGLLTDDDVLELLECHWLKQAQNVPLWFLGVTSTGHIADEGYSHFEVVTIGGVKKDGQDATNELTYLILQSRKEFPLNYPEVVARVHSRSPQSFLMQACDCAKQGTGFPKFLNDEEIVPSLVGEGATWEEARDYCGSGCAEVKMPNRDAGHSVPATFSLGAALDMSLHDGKSRTGEQIGVSTGDPRGFATFDDVMKAFRLQIENLIKYVCVKETFCDLVRQDKLVTPMHSCLHDLCLREGRDINSARIPDVIYDDGFIIPCGFGTAVDSLAAIKKLVFDERKVSMGELLEALDTNFEGKEALRQMCLQSPKYGNNNPYADALGRQVDGMMVEASLRYTGLNGGKLQVIAVPVTAHVMYGAMLGATANGRKAKEPLSDGISPSQGCDGKGPTAALLSVANIKEQTHRDRRSQLLNMKFSPQALAGDSGTRNLVALIRTWCELKIWHIQLNVVNTETLRDAQKRPEQYRNLVVRVSGYSAYFVDLTRELQNDIIRRTEQLAA